MYLSKLEIIGFKSFAQKVNLSFDSGISAIVGPNGCGKTNIVDAIRWVLGEQRYSALRSEKMEDVIFNGTKNRKPLGMAEASLVIENNKGILPSEYTQVTIGRRVFRSGESEYLLNKVPCRLKDILDLFMDTGMGTDAYSVIELKMIETILSDKTDERRRLFEEAAGVTKYKHRRKAAYRKLEAVQADLVRVNDIVTEVQKAVTTLERQAKKAEQYNEVKRKLQALEIDLMEREYAHVVSRLLPLEEKLAAMVSDRERVDGDLSQEEARFEQLRGSMAEVEKRLAEAQRDVSLQTQKINKIEQQNLIARERINALHTTILRYENEREDLRAEQERLEHRVVALELEIAAISERRKTIEREVQERRAEWEAVGERLSAKQAELAALNQRTIELVHAIAEEQSQQEKLKAKVENLHGRAARAAEENAAYEQELQRLAREIDELTAEDKRLRRSFTEAEMRYYEAERQKKELGERLDALQREEMEVESEIRRRAERRDFLKGLIESREGFSESVRFLASSGKWKHAAHHLTVADAVHAEERYAPAIEAALGEYASLIVVPSADDAEEAIALLKEEQKGKASFVCLDRVPRVQAAYLLPQQPGVVCWALDVAQFEPQYAPLFRYLLDRVVIVEDAAAAKRVAAHSTGLRCVTLDGETTTSVGLTRGGSKRLDEGGVIGKQKQMAVLEQEIEALKAKRATLAQTRAALTAEEEAMHLKSMADAVKVIEKEMNGVEMRIAQLEFERKRANDIIAKNVEELSALHAETTRRQDDITTSAPTLERLREEKTAVEQRIGKVAQEREVLEAEYERRAAAVKELEIQAVQLKGDLQNAENELQRSRDTIAGIVAALAQRQADSEAGHQDIATAEASIAENAEALAVLQHELDLLVRHKQEVEQENARLREEMHRIQMHIKDERRIHDDTLKAVHDTELKIADLKAKIEHLKDRAFTEFETELTLKTYPPDEFVDFAALRDEIQAFRDKIKALGNINFAAFEEYTKEKERYEFLSSQRNDLIEAEKTLLATIEEINQTAQKKFLKTFEQIRQNFIATFKSLFDPGDECDLKLEEGADPLEASIDIMAKPRGKRPTSIHLLSGGEKTLTAIALLFAIYLVKPSPFCILDEVDAPLDDANIDRFTRILRKFSDNTQFIVVTHNKRTMEAANALYGVTMEEEGVSKIVTVRFNQDARVETAVVASG
ncbi:MAG: chromosome segregation protein SMC [Ignavibacteria bacterium]